MNGIPMFWPSVNLEKAIRPFAAEPLVPTKKRVNFLGGDNTSGETSGTEGEPVPVLEFSASVRPEVITLGSMGYVINLGEDDDSEDVIQEETNRVTHFVRIYSDDGESYIDIEVTDQIEFLNKSEKKRKFNYLN